MEKPQRTRLALPLLIAAPQLLWGAAVRADEGWPSKPIDFVIPYPPGGSTDLLGRMLADKMAPILNANFVMINKPGATTQIANELVANAKPDGNTILLSAATSYTSLPNMRNLKFSIDSFSVVGGVADYIAVMAVRNDLPIKTVKEFVEYARQNPGKLIFGSAGIGSAGHIYGMTLAHDTGINILHVPYKGSMAAVNSLVAGETDFIIDGAITPMVKADRVQALATFNSKRHPLLPDVPTVSQAGFDVSVPQANSWGLVAPRGTPQSILSKLQAAVQQVLNDRDLTKKLASANAIPSWQTPIQYKEGLAADRKVYADLLPKIGIHKE